VANAGRGLYGRVHESSWSEIREHLEVNVASTVSLMRLLSPRMILRRRQLQNDGLVNSNPSASGGRILVISSAAGVGPGADIALYAATKAFLTTFALSLRRELLSEGILVSVATPGPLLGTNFLSKVRNMKHVPISFRLPVLAMGVDTAADQIIRGMIMGREIVSPGFLAKFYVHIVAKLLPSSLISVGVQNLWKPIPNIRLLAKKSKKLHSKQSNVVQRGDEEMTSQHTIRKSRLSQHRPFLKSKLSQWNPLMKLRKRWIPKWNIFGTKISKYEIEESFLREMKQLQLSEEEAEVAALRNTYVYMDSSDVSREKLVEEVPTPIVSLENEF
jgi:short-subunit dehydrogenase